MTNSETNSENATTTATRPGGVPERRRAVVFPEPGRAVLVEEPYPTPGPGELLVATTRSLISTGSEGIVLGADYGPGTHWYQWVHYPVRPGYSNAGRVAAVGAGVSGWEVGDRACSRTGHADYVIAPADRVARVPNGVSDDEAAWVMLGKIAQAGVRAAPHVLGDSVVVFGLGLLGQLVVQYSRLLGALEVIAVDPAPRRARMAADHGATRELATEAEGAKEAVMEATAGRGADVVYAITGNAAVLAAALPLVRAFGTLVLLGDTGWPSRQCLTHNVIVRGLRLVGAHDHHAPHRGSPHTPWTDGRQRDLVLRYVQRGEMRVADLITHRFPPEDAVAAYDLLRRERDTATGVLFVWD